MSRKLASRRKRDDLATIGQLSSSYFEPQQRHLCTRYVNQKYFGLGTEKSKAERQHS